MNLSRVRGICALTGIIMLASTGTSWAVTPVTFCGQVLDTPGELYILTGDLDCSGIAPTSAAVRIKANNVRFDLRGFRIIGNGPGGGTGVKVNDILSAASLIGVRIQNGTIEKFETGIDLSHTRFISLNRLTVGLCHLGIQLFDSNEGLFTGDELTANGVGFNVFDSRNNLFLFNIVSFNTSQGIALFGSTRNVVAGNRAEDNGTVGITLQAGSHGNLVQSNTVVDTGLTSGDLQPSGISSSGSDNNTIRANIVERSIGGGAGGFGIGLGNGMGNIVRDNRTNNNGIGIVLHVGAVASRVEGNTALKNSIFDLADFNAACDANVWVGNIYETKNQPCVD